MKIISNSIGMKGKNHILWFWGGGGRWIISSNIGGEWHREIIFTPVRDKVGQSSPTILE